MDIKGCIENVINNGLRIFEDHLTRPQNKAVKSVVRGIIRKTTTILARLNEGDINDHKYREKISKHLKNINLVDIVEEKSYRCLRKKIKDEDAYIYASYDESDVFKPDSKKMPGLRWIRDGSTGATGKGYLLRGVNVNGISVYSRFEEADANKITKSDYIFEAIDHVYRHIEDKRLVFLIDRGGDCTELFDEFLGRDLGFVIRGKTNRLLTDVNSGKQRRVVDFPLGRTEVMIEGGTCVYVRIIKVKEHREPIILYTNIEGLVGDEVLQMYLKRRKIEEDFNKMKDLGLEEVRLMSMKAIKNILAIIQFIIILAQDVYNEVMERSTMVTGGIYKYFEKFCKKRSTTMNPQSFIRFVSEYIKFYESYNISSGLGNTLFGGVRELKKMGLI